jgi:glycosyltransferase involved in cell wall biosynthesis
MRGKGHTHWDRGTDWAPVVTAILPCYNAETFLARTLDSLDAQTWPKLEILIGDDASTDGTLRIVEAFAKGRSDTRIIVQKQNLGWIGNSNDLMAKASGELMFFAFHDDVVLPTYTERLVEALQGNPRAVLSYCDLDVVGRDGSRRLVCFDRPPEGMRPLARGYSMVTKPRGWSIPVHGVFRTEAFHRIGGLKRHDEGEFTADWPWLLHMAILGEFVRVPEPLSKKYFQKTSISRNWERSARQQMAMVRSGIREIRQSDLGLLSKAALIAYLKLRHARMRVLSMIPRPLKTLVKRLLGRNRPGAP